MLRSYSLLAPANFPIAFHFPSFLLFYQAVFLLFLDKIGQKNPWSTSEQSRGFRECRLNLFLAVGLHFSVFVELALDIGHVVDAAKGFGKLHGECAVLRHLPVPDPRFYAICRCHGAQHSFRVL